MTKPTPLIEILQHPEHREALAATLTKMLNIGAQHKVPIGETALTFLSHVSAYEQTYVPPKKKSGA